MAIFEGSGVALITPFKDNGVDFEKLKELLGHTPLQVVVGAILGFVIACIVHLFY